MPTVSFFFPEAIPYFFNPYNFAPVEIFPSPQPDGVFALLNPGEQYSFYPLAHSIDLIWGNVEPDYTLTVGDLTYNGANVLAQCPYCGPGIDNVLAVITGANVFTLQSFDEPMLVGFAPAVPEPSTWLLMLLGGAALFAFGKWKYPTGVNP